MAGGEKSLIMIVDDNPQNIRVLGNTLEEHGYEPAVFLSGQEALEFLLKEKPELILLDIMMPEMDGYEVCRYIKEDVTTKNIPVIFLTAKSETEDLVKGFEVGAADYVTKPFKAAELLARIKTHIGFKRALEEIKTLRGIIPICVKCKKVRDDEGLWNRIEQYIEDNSEALFSHGMCPECMDNFYGDQTWYKRDDV
ncbi:MAG: response regulator [Desulfobacterales bacterium]|nr:response regulator [Desulfobacterales bacterium]